MTHAAAESAKSIVCLAAKQLVINVPGVDDVSLEQIAMRENFGVVPRCVRNARAFASRQMIGQLHFYHDCLETTS